MNDNELLHDDTHKILGAESMLDGKDGKIYFLCCIAEFEFEKEAFEQDVPGSAVEVMQKTKEEAIAAGQVTADGRPVFTREHYMGNVLGRINEFSSYALQKKMTHVAFGYKKNHDVSGLSDNEYFERIIQAVKDELQAEYNGGEKPKFLNAKFVVLDPDRKTALYGDQEIFDKVLKAHEQDESTEQPQTQNGSTNGISEVANKAKSFAEDVSSGKNKTANAIITVILFVIIAVIVVVTLLNK